MSDTFKKILGGGGGGGMCPTKLTLIYDFGLPLARPALKKKKLQRSQYGQGHLREASACVELVYILDICI